MEGGRPEQRSKMQFRQVHGHSAGTALRLVPAYEWSNIMRHDNRQPNELRSIKIKRRYTSPRRAAF